MTPSGPAAPHGITWSRGFKPSVKFGLVAFSTDARAWRHTQLVDANNRNQRAPLE